MQATVILPVSIFEQSKELRAQGIALLAYISSQVGPGQDVIEINTKEYSQALGVSVSTLRRWIKKLEALGILVFEKLKKDVRHISRCFKIYYDKLMGNEESAKKNVTPESAEASAQAGYPGPKGKESTGAEIGMMESAEHASSSQPSAEVAWVPDISQAKFRDDRGDERILRGDSAAATDNHLDNFVKTLSHAEWFALCGELRLRGIDINHGDAKALKAIPEDDPEFQKIIMGIMQARHEMEQAREKKRKIAEGQEKFVPVGSYYKEKWG